MAVLFDWDGRFFMRKRYIIIILLIVIGSVSSYLFYENMRQMGDDSKQKDFQHVLKDQFSGIYPKLVKLLYDYDKDMPGVGRKMKLPLFQIVLSRKDVVHFSELYGKYEDPAFGSRYYTQNNKWRKASLIFNGKTYKIKIKSHGRAPTGHRRGNYISYSIKLRKGEQINNAKRFNLIIRDRVFSYQLFVNELAEYFGIISQKREAISVRVNNWDEKLYYLENRLDDAFMEAEKKSSYRIFSYSSSSLASSDKALISHDSEFNSKELQHKFKEVFKDSEYPEKHREAIYERYSDLNKAISNKNFEELENYFDIEYITSFEAVRALSGLIGHGLINGNFYVFFDTASGKFYPTIRRDNIPSKLNLDGQKTPEQLGNLWTAHDGDVFKFPLFYLLSQNDQIRQKKYRKIYQFITNDGEKSRKQFQDLVENNRKTHYAGWLKLLLSGLFPYNDIVGHNMNVLKEYLENSSPQISLSSNDQSLMVELEPASMSAIGFKQLRINLPQLKTGRIKGIVKVVISEGDKIIRVWEDNFVVKQGAGRIELKDVVGQIGFSSALDKESNRLKRSYNLLFSFPANVNLANAKDTTSFVLYNKVTGKTLDSSTVTLVSPEKPIAQIKGLFPDKNQLDSRLKRIGDIFNYSITKNEFTIHPGDYEIKEDVIVPDNLKLIIEEGTRLRLGEGKVVLGKNGITIKGTKEKPVVITSIDPAKPFGSVGILGDQNTTSDIRYLRLSNGSERWINGAFFSGGLSIHYNKLVTISDSVISDNKADDGLNVKYAEFVLLKNNQFSNNFADQVDLDYCKGLIQECYFIYSATGDKNGDGLDVSGSHFLIENNSFKGFKDKGASVGEMSSVVLKQNLFEDNLYGIAVKDLSKAFLIRNQFKSNSIDINAYQKKKIFGGGSVYVESGFGGSKKYDEKSIQLFFNPAGIDIPTATDSDIEGLETYLSNLEKTSYLEQ